MKIFFLAATLLLTSVFSVFSQSKTKIGTIVLVHGAWSDVSAWDKIAPALKAKGYEVVSVNLPGHGKDNTSFAGITMNTYVDAVKGAVGNRQNIILVGHSMGGVIISAVAEQIPGQIKKLIYLAGFVPANGESLLGLAQTDAESHIGKFLQINQLDGKAGIAKDGIVDVFAADADQAVAAHLVTAFKAEPLAPFAAPITLTEANFGKVPKVYIHTIDDHAISYPFQQKMVTRAVIARTYALPSSHTPFLSMPGLVTAIILQEAQ